VRDMPPSWRTCAYADLFVGHHTSQLSVSFLGPSRNDRVQPNDRYFRANFSLQAPKTRFGQFECQRKVRASLGIGSNRPDSCRAETSDQPFLILATRIARIAIREVRATDSRRSGSAKGNVAFKRALFRLDALFHAGYSTASVTVINAQWYTYGFMFNLKPVRVS
jgi:hypothetical protein